MIFDALVTWSVVPFSLLVIQLQVHPIVDLVITQRDVILEYRVPANKNQNTATSVFEGAFLNVILCHLFPLNVYTHGCARIMNCRFMKFVVPARRKTG